MATPAPSEFQPYRRVQNKADDEIKRILESSARAIRARVATLKPGVGGEVRKAQLNATLAAIARLQKVMWAGKLAPAVARGIDEAIKAAEDATEAMSRVAYAALPEKAADELVRGLGLAAQSGIKSDAARRKRELSTRIYRQRSLDDGKVEQMIREGLIANLSAKELAQTVYKHVSPTAPGGTSYAAMRLARTEINNAFHERQIEGAKRPGVSAVKWNLSGSHKVPDLCNVYAEKSGNGHWPVDGIPEKPHPNCFCYLTYVTMPPEDFQAELAKGSFDDEIERRTRENMARLGQPVGNTAPPALKLVEKSKRQPDGYLEGDWSKAGLQEEIQKLAKQINEAASPEKRKAQREKLGPDWAMKVAEMLMDGVVDDGSVMYQNGDHRVNFTGSLTPAQQRQFLEHFDFMQTNFPVGRGVAMHITVGPSKDFGEGVGGETTLGTGSMFINEDVVRRDRWPSGMPMRRKVSSAMYVLAHEWGHSCSTPDEARQKHVHSEACATGDMSRYGTSGVDGVLAPAEGYAEAFAEWALSKGTTTNSAAIEYANHFGWRERFETD